MWWEGVILAHENENPVVEDDDITLAALIGNVITETENEEMLLPPTTECSMSEKVINETLNQDTQDLPCSIYQETCEHLNCKSEVFSACTKCLAFLCYDDSVMNLPCETHTSSETMF